MMDGKRGQIAVFIVVGVVVLLGVLLYLLYPEQESSPIRNSVDAAPVTFYVESCLGEIIQSGLLYLGEQSWDAEATTTLEDGRTIQTKQRIDKTTHYPNREELADGLQQEIVRNAQNCFDVKDTTTFTIKEYTLQDAQVTVQEQSIHVELNAPTIVINKDAHVTINQYTKDIAFPVEDVTTTLTDFLSTLETNYPQLPAGELAVLSLEKKFTYNTLNLDRDHVLFTVSFDYILVQDEQYAFSFIAEYPWEEMLGVEE